jgi:pilus assembly protein CpaE
MQALERLMARIGAWPPVVVVTQAFDENVARTLLQMRVADFPGEAGSPVELVRTCARVAKGGDRDRRDTEPRSTPSCPRSAAPALPRSRCRRR